MSDWHEVIFIGGSLHGTVRELNLARLRFR